VAKCKIKNEGIYWIIDKNKIASPPHRRAGPPHSTPHINTLPQPLNHSQVQVPSLRTGGHSMAGFGLDKSSPYKRKA